MERAERVAAVLDGDAFAAHLGISLVGVDNDSVTVSMPVTGNHENFRGGTHGGALFSVADCAFSLASNAYEQPAVAVDTHLAITAPTTTGDLLTATAVEVQRGKRLATYRVEITRSDRRVCGHSREPSSSRVTRKPRDRTCSVFRHTSAISREPCSTARRK